MLKSYLSEIIKKIDDLSTYSEGLADKAADFMKDEINTGIGTGHVYKRNGRTHRASSPGQPPKTDTGELSKSITARRTGVGSSEVRIKSKHAAALEYGTSKMRPRPFVAPAVTELKKQVHNKLKGDWS